VTEGYAILQPRVGIRCPAPNRSRFARLFASDPGIDPYIEWFPMFYQDVFHEGRSSAREFYDVDARPAGDRERCGKASSARSVEGVRGDRGLVSDVLLFEEYPSSYPADVSRRYRWIRGDCQIAPWLLAHVPGGDGNRVPNPLSSFRAEDTGQHSPQPDTGGACWRC